jgi:hypothetical protein
MAHLSRLNYGNLINDSKCNYLYNDCHVNNKDACVISSPGYPGVYLKGLDCSYSIKKSYDDKIDSTKDLKLILINDNMHLDATLCHYEQNSSFWSNTTKYTSSNAHLMSSSFFCDEGVRSDRSCQDSFNIESSNGSLLLHNICGMGKMPKYVTRKPELLLKFSSSSDGQMVNTGFLFYAMKHNKYMEMYELFNSFSKSEFKSKAELNWLKIIEKLQIESCDSNDEVCLICLNDTITNKHGNFLNSKSNNKEVKHDEHKNQMKHSKFNVGYLYGMNQYHPANFTLKYVLRGNFHNSIALNIEKYQPAASSAKSASITKAGKCENSYLTIETIEGQHHADNTIYEEEEEEKEKGLKESINFDDILLEVDEMKNSESDRLASSQIFMKHKISSRSYSFNERTNTQQSQLLVKLCDAEDLNNNYRFFLIKSSSSVFKLNKSDDWQTNTVPNNNINKTENLNVLITYFSSTDALFTNRLFDFKIGFEYVNFDWSNYQKSSVCDFIYNINTDKQMKPSGHLTNPQATIFYKTSDEFLKCRYRLVARLDQYIKLTFKSIEFGSEPGENIYFHEDSDETSMRLLSEQCLRINRRLIVREMRNPSKEIVNMSNYYEESSTAHHFNLNRLCICKLMSSTSGVKKHSQVYISRHNALEIEYLVRLDKFNEPLADLKSKYSFHLKYEYINRSCDKFILKGEKKSSSHKGRLVHSMNDLQGIQTHLVDHLEQLDTILNETLTNASLSWQPADFHSSLNSLELTKITNEYESMKLLLQSNLNFHCIFHIKSPKNHFVHIEFNDLIMPKECDRNSLRIYSNFSKFSQNANDLARTHELLLRLCSSNEIEKKESSLSKRFWNESSNNVKYRQRSENVGSLKEKSKNALLKKNAIIVEFTDESIANLTLRCSNSKYKLCLMSNELNNEYNPLRKSSKSIMRKLFDFSNEITIEILAYEMREVYFDIKYFFYKLEYENLEIEVNSKKRTNEDKNNLTQHNSNSTETKLLIHSSMLGIQHKRKTSTCEFKCNSILNDFNETIKVCLDRSLLCDYQIQCIYSDEDEKNCNND